jgi:hypothetical protein
MWMFNHQNVPPYGTEVPREQACYRCTRGEISQDDVFGSHCAGCLAELAAEAEHDFGDIGPAQAILANHRAFADWLHRRGRRSRADAA